MKRTKLLFAAQGCVAMAVVCVLLSARGYGQLNSGEGPVRDDRIGVVTHFNQNSDPNQLMPEIAALGVGWIRDEISWGALEPQKGVYKIPQKTMNWLLVAKASHIKVLLILNFANPIYEDHYDTQAYAKAAAWLVNELKDKISAIEVLNEPNNFGFRAFYGGAWNGHEIDGSVSPYVKKYVEILNAAATEIKKVNPRIPVIGGSAPPPATFRMIDLGIVPQVEAITDHPYPRAQPEFIPYAATALLLVRDGIATADDKGTFFSAVAMFRARNAEHHGPPELWDTEWGIATVAPFEKRGALTEETQAVYIARRVIECFGLGVNRNFIYQLVDGGTDLNIKFPDTCGLLTKNLSHKQSYYCLQRLLKFLAGAPVVKPEDDAQFKPDPGVRVYTFASPEQGRAIVAFWKVTDWPGGEAGNLRLTVKSVPPVSSVIYNPLIPATTPIAPLSASGGKISYDVTATGAVHFLVIETRPGGH